MSYIRVRQRNQLTLPKEISSALQVKEGDFLEVSTSENAVILRPTRIVKFGTLEGDEEDRRAEQDFREGRYRTFDSVERFTESLGLSPEAPIAMECGGSDSVERLVAALLNEAGGDAVAAAERLEQAMKALGASSGPELAALSQGR